MKKGVIAACMLLAMWCAGCAMNGYQQVRPSDYPATHTMFDVTFGWKKNVTDSAMTIDGYVRNNRYAIISDMDMTVSLLDVSGREKAREDFIFVPTRLSMDNLASFSVALKARPQAGDMLRFLYRYNAQDGKNEGLSWRNSFQVPALD